MRYLSETLSNGSCTIVGCNLAIFRDTGVRNFHRILVVTEPGPHDSLIVHTADELIHEADCEITFMNALPVDASLPEVQSVRDYHGQLQQLCASTTHSVVLQDRNPSAALVHATAAYDLLIMAASDETALAQHVSQFTKAPPRATSRVLGTSDPNATTPDS